MQNLSVTGVWRMYVCMYDALLYVYGWHESDLSESWLGEQNWNLILTCMTYCYKCETVKNQDFDQKTKRTHSTPIMAISLVSLWWENDWLCLGILMMSKETQASYMQTYHVKTSSHREYWWSYVPDLLTKQIKLCVLSMHTNPLLSTTSSINYTYQTHQQRIFLLKIWNQGRLLTVGVDTHDLHHDGSNSSIIAHFS